MPASLSQTCEPKEDTRYEHHCCSLIWPSSMEKKSYIIQIWCGKFKEKICKKKKIIIMRVDLNMRVVWKLLRHLLLLPSLEKDISLKNSPENNLG